MSICRLAINNILYEKPQAVPLNHRGFRFRPGLSNRKIRAKGQNYHHFRDLFSCTILMKYFPETGSFLSFCPNAIMRFLIRCRKGKSALIVDSQPQSALPHSSFGSRTRTGHIRIYHHQQLHAPEVRPRVWLRKFSGALLLLRTISRTSL